MEIWPFLADPDQDQISVNATPRFCSGTDIR